MTPSEHGRRLSEHGAERRQQIVDTAMQLFTDKGYAATRISDICDRAGVAKGLYYWYFDTKLAVFVEVAASVRRQLRRAQADAFGDDADALTRICQGSAATVRFMAEFANYFALVDAERADPAIRDALREGGRVYLADVVNLIREGQADGTIDGRDPTLLAYGVLGTVSTFTSAARSGSIDRPVDELADFVACSVHRQLTT